MINVQKTYQNQIATLFLVTTPIGDRVETSSRTLQTLTKVTVVFSEDTQHSQRFLTNLGIKTKLLSFHKFNEKGKIVQALKYLRSGFHIALISCAGTPLIADPGYQLVVDVVKAGFNVTSIGVSSPLLAALICSAIPCHKFIFTNFLLPSRRQKSAQIKELLTNSETIVCYESVHKIEDTLRIMKEVAPDRQFCLAREISKQHETFYRGLFKNLSFKDVVFKGEFTLVVAGLKKTVMTGTDLFIDKMRRLRLNNRQIVAVGKELGFSKKNLYNALLLKPNSDE